MKYWLAGEQNMKNGKKRKYKGEEVENRGNGESFFIWGKNMI